MIFLPTRGFWRIPGHLRRRRSRPLDATERSAIVRLNAELAAIERHISDEATAVRIAFQQRLADGDPGLSDFELEGRVSFHVRQDDPRYDDGRDDVMAELRVDLKEHDRGRDYPLPLFSAELDENGEQVSSFILHLE